MTPKLRPQSHSNLAAFVAALVVLAFVLFTDEPTPTPDMERRFRREQTRRDLKPVFDELRNE